MRARTFTSLVSIALIAGVTACGSDDEQASGSSDTATTTAERETEGSATDDDSAGNDDAAGGDSTADITIDGKKLGGDLFIACDSPSMGGAPNSVYVSNGDGDVTLDGAPVSRLVSISVGYDGSGSEMSAKDVVVSMPGVDIISGPAGLPGAGASQIGGQSDGETWTFNYSGPSVTDQSSTHTVEGTVTCTPPA